MLEKPHFFGILCEDRCTRTSSYLSDDQFVQYMQTLVDAFNPAAIGGLMCRNTLSVGWDGRLYDYDFNQMLNLEVAKECRSNIEDFNYDSLLRRAIIVGQHCYGQKHILLNSIHSATTEAELYLALGRLLRRRVRDGQSTKSCAQQVNLPLRECQCILRYADSSSELTLRALTKEWSCSSIQRELHCTSA